MKPEFMLTSRAPAKPRSSIDLAELRSGCHEMASSGAADGAPGHFSNNTRIFHTVFDDAVHAHWSISSGAVVVEDWASDGGIFCGHHLRVVARSNQESHEQHDQPATVILRARSPILGLDEAGVGIQFSFLAKAAERGALHTALSSVPLCPPRHGGGSSDDGSQFNRRVSRLSTSCESTALCVALHASASQPSRPVGFMPVCAARTEASTPPVSSDRLPWRRFLVPTRGFGVARPQTLVVASGVKSATSLLLDDLQFVSLRAPTRVSAAFFDGPPHVGAAYAARAPSPRITTSGGLGWCRYMSSDFRPGAAKGAAKRRAPRCRMDGDHLRGRWLQNCDPRSEPLLRSRPDVYAYGRALPRIQGKFDFRVCYRVSFWERERALQALSWTWRPYDCRLEPFDASAFDAWLANRTMVLVGDSLTAQLYYSLIFLLGEAVVETVEHADGMRRAGGNGGRMPATPATSPSARCSSGVADEGLSSFSEARLSRGGRLISAPRWTGSS